MMRVAWAWGLLAGLGLLLLVAVGAQATTFTVNNTDDSGTGSLRQAMIDAINDPAEPHEIHITVSGTIAVDSDLPPMNRTVKINGTGYPPTVEITNGTSSTATVGLYFVGGATGSSGSTLANVSITGFSAAGVHLDANSITLHGNYIGLTPAGAASGNGVGVLVDAGGTSTTIGGTGAGEGNVISGNTNQGIRATGSATLITILGNHVGTDPAGAAALGNGGNGIEFDSADGFVGDGTAAGRNVISGNAFVGVDVFGDGSAVTVDGNYIGTNAAGTAGLGTQDWGLGAGDTGAGSTPASVIFRDNVIAGNDDFGIRIFNGGFLTVDVDIDGNLIGVAADGETAIAGHSGGGIRADDLSTSPGVADTITDNVVVNAGDAGIWLTDSAGVTITGNHVGITDAGSAVGNAAGGVVLDGTSTDNIVGGAASLQNIIAHNTGDGIVVKGAGSTGNDIRANSIHSNSEIGIDLVSTGQTAPGVTPNDAGDLDGSPNRLQNYPNVTAVAPVEGGVNITFDWDGSTGGSATFRFYRNTACDGSGYGEGETYLGEVSITPVTGSNTVTLTGTAYMAGEYTGTSTDDGTGDTSEFGPCFTAAALPTTVTVNHVGDTGDTAPGDGACDTGGALVGGQPQCTLRAAIEEALAFPRVIDTIHFNIPGSGPHVLSPATALPIIYEPMTIDGSTEPDHATGAPSVVVDGSTPTSGQEGIFWVQDTVDVTIRGLEITGNPVGDGIHIQALGPQSGHVVAGNVIHNNLGDGVAIYDEDNNTVGGPSAADRNYIFDNFGDGVNLYNTVDSTIENNWIGIAPNGSVLGNFWSGVYLESSDRNTIVSNVIVDHSYDGVTLDFSDDNTITSNRIGITAGGIKAGNLRAGVLVGSGDDNTIGAPGAGNIITDNGGGFLEMGTGVALVDFEGLPAGNSIRGNSIYQNYAGGIDLHDDGVTSNDLGSPHDSDSGPNGLQNFPNITFAQNDGLVKGFLKSTPSTTFKVDFYENVACDTDFADTSGRQHGEGRIYRGTLTVTTDSAGNATFSGTISDLTTDRYLTATATDPDGNTSEFSTCKKIVKKPGGGIDIPIVFPSSSTSGTTAPPTTPPPSTPPPSTPPPSTGPVATGTGTLNPTPETYNVQVKQDGETVNPLNGVQGDFDVEVTGDIPPGATITVQLIAADGTIIEVEADGRTASFNTDDLPSGWYTIRVFVSGGTGGSGFQPLQAELQVGERTILILHPTEEFTPTAKAAATGVAIVGTFSLIFQTIWSQAFGFLGEAGKEGAIAIGEDRLRQSGATAAAARKRWRAIGAFIAAVSLLGVFFALEGAPSFAPADVLSVLPVIGICALFFFSGQFSLEYGLSRASGVAARFRFLWAGAVALALSTLIFRVAFGYPGFVDEADDVDHYRRRRMMGIRSLATFAGMIAVTLPFIWAGRYLSWPFYEEGMTVAVVAIATATMPFAPLPGADVWRWKWWISLLSFAGAIVLFFGFLLAVISPLHFVWLAIGSVLFYLMTIWWLRLRLARPAWYARITDRYQAFWDAIEGAKPQWVKDFRASRQRFWRGVGDGWLRAMSVVGFAVAQLVRKIQRKPPLTRHE